jgi:polyadenylation factor subunit 2
MTNLKNLQDGHFQAVRGLSYSPMETKFVSGSDDATLKIWDFATHSVEKELKEHLSDVKCVQWHPDRALICSGSKDNSVKLWDPRQEKSVRYVYMSEWFSDMSIDCDMYSSVYRTIQ